MKKKVQIVLATYNGEKYIEEQINSILSQTYKNWELLIRDDGSKDNTLNIIDRYIKNYPEKIFLISDNLGKLGPCYNFLNLLKLTDKDYVFFCDQDDIWSKNKLKIFVEKFIAIESKSNIPILLHSDLVIIDENKNIICDSYIKLSKINPLINKSLKKILVRNFPGCSMAINKTLIEKLFPLPKGILMHDLWVSIIAVLLGEIHYIDEKLIYYRVHNNNTIGLGKNRGKISFDLFTLILNFKNKKLLFWKDNLPRIEQAKIILDNYYFIKKEDKNTLKSFLNLKSYNWIMKRIIFIRNNFLDQDLIRNIRFFLYL
ncbi:MAG: glycosyltransferase family 2 protein [Candidatus Sericytochromatia bacterium]